MQDRWAGNTHDIWIWGDHDHPLDRDNGAVQRPPGEALGSSGKRLPPVLFTHPTFFTHPMLYTQRIDGIIFRAMVILLAWICPLNRS